MKIHKQLLCDHQYEFQITKIMGGEISIIELHELDASSLIKHTSTLRYIQSSHSRGHIWQSWPELAMDCS